MYKLKRLVAEYIDYFILWCLYAVIFLVSDNPILIIISLLIISLLYICKDNFFKSRSIGKIIFKLNTYDQFGNQITNNRLLMKKNLLDLLLVSFNFIIVLATTRTVGDYVFKTYVFSKDNKNNKPLIIILTVFFLLFPFLFIYLANGYIGVSKITNGLDKQVKNSKVLNEIGEVKSVKRDKLFSKYDLMRDEPYIKYDVVIDKKYRVKAYLEYAPSRFIITKYEIDGKVLEEKDKLIKEENNVKIYQRDDFYILKIDINNNNYFHTCDREPIISFEDNKIIGRCDFDKFEYKNNATNDIITN